MVKQPSKAGKKKKIPAKREAETRVQSAQKKFTSANFPYQELWKRPGPKKKERKNCLKDENRNQGGETKNFLRRTRDHRLKKKKKLKRPPKRTFGAKNGEKDWAASKGKKTGRVIGVNRVEES